jgi:hypothetical protein
MKITSSQKVKAMFKPYSNLIVETKNIRINRQLRGCSGFIQNKDNEKIVYLTTEPISYTGNTEAFQGNGLYGDNNKACMYRTAKTMKDYTGGINQWCSLDSLKTSILSALS